HCRPSAKHERWGNGWRSRRELIRNVLPQLGLSRELVYHGVRREIFLVPLADNAREFLRGETEKLRPYSTTTEQLFAWFRERWLLPRAARDQRYVTFEPGSLRLWENSTRDG
ncbi:MAG: Druantia anti-phage system protein DruA, partial [Acidobacteriota bacterium]